MERTSFKLLIGVWQEIIIIIVDLLSRFSNKLMKIYNLFVLGFFFFRFCFR